MVTTKGGCCFSKNKKKMKTHNNKNCTPPGEWVSGFRVLGFVMLCCYPFYIIYIFFFWELGGVATPCHFRHNLSKRKTANCSRTENPAEEEFCWGECGAINSTSTRCLEAPVNALADADVDVDVDADVDVSADADVGWMLTTLSHCHALPDSA